MAAVVRIRQAWPQEVARSPEMAAVLRAHGEKIAEEANRLGRQVARSYSAEVTHHGGKTTVEANTGGINAASWIEFGTNHTPAHAPLRRGAESAGARLKGGKR